MESTQSLLNSLRDIEVNLNNIQKSLSPKQPISLIRSLSDNLASHLGPLQAIKIKVAAYSTTDEEELKTLSESTELVGILSNKIRDLSQKVVYCTKGAAEEKKTEGNNFFKEGTYDKALESYDEAISIDGNNAIYYTNKALTLQKLDCWEESLKAATTAITLDSQLLKAYVILIKSQLKLNRIEECSNTCENLPNSHKDKPEITELKKSISVAAKDEGNSHFKTGNFDTAIQFYTIAIHNDATNHFFFSNRSACYQSKKEWQAAIADANETLRLNPQFAKGYLHLARSQVQLKQWDEAARTLRRAVNELRPTGDLASVQAQIDEINKQIQDATASISKPNLTPPSASELSRAEVFKTKGNALYKAGEYQDAIRAYSQAIAVCPTEGTFFGNRAACWMMLKEFKRAQSDCLEGLKFERRVGELDKLRLRLASSLSNQGKIGEAIQGLSSVINEGEEEEGEEGEGEVGGMSLGLPGSRSPEALAPFTQQLQALTTAQNNLDLAKRSVENKEYSRSLRLLQLALEGGGLEQHVGVHVLLAKAHLGLGDLEESSREAQKAISASGGSGSDCIDAYSTRAEALKGLGITEQACKHYSAALQLDPDNQEVVRKLKALRRVISETNRIRGEITTAMNHSHFEVAANLCTEGLQIDRESKSLMGEMSYRRGKAYFLQARAVAKHPRWGEGADPTTFFRKALQDANGSLYYEKTNTEAVFLKADALEAMLRFEESVDELTQFLKALGEAEDERRVKERLKQAQLALKKSKRKDYYALLGLESNPHLTDEDISRAYKKLALKHHPDRFAGKSEEEKKEAELKFKEILDAKDLLTDPVRRRLYDQGHDREEVEQMAEMEKQQAQHGGGGGGRRGGFHHGGFGF